MSGAKHYEKLIAEHACRKYSGRVGRSAGAKVLDGEAARWAVIAHIRHAETNYDELLLRMCERSEARMLVRDAVAEIIDRWQQIQFVKDTEKNEVD